MTKLADGRHVIIRRLHGCDADALVAALQKADPTDLRRRFMGNPPPASYLVKRLRSADGVHDFVLGAFDETGRLVGLAQFDRPNNEPTAEVAIEVAKDWQHDGLGIALLRRLAHEARALGINEFTARFFADNVPIQRLLHDIGHVIASDYAMGEGFVRMTLQGAVRPSRAG